MDKKILILVSGKLQSGKNQSAKFLEDILRSKGLSVTQDLFAQTLKDFCKEDFQILGKVLEEKVISLVATISAYVENAPHGSSEISILKYLREQLITQFTFSDENFYESKTDITRALLQLYGTDIVRKRFDDFYWIDSLIERCMKCDNDVVIVTDVRFPNEIDYVISKVQSFFDVFSVRVDRNISREEIANQHISECALDTYKEFSYRVMNNGTLSTLHDNMSIISADILESVNNHTQKVF